jgi:hypothetical protein
MTIKVYNSIMPGEPAETYDRSGLTVEAFVKSFTPNYRRGDSQPISCMINGAIVKPMDWADAVIGESDVVELRPVPYGDVVDALAIVFPTVFGPIAGPQLAIEALIDIPGQQGGQGSQGSQLNPADARANIARLGQGIPEGFGYYIRYPDYLNQPRTFYQDRKTQVIRLLLSVGVGEYEIDPDSVKIGETPINELNNADFTIYGPGADLSGVPNHENWFQSPEVGGTQGSAGIRLKGVTYDQRTYFGSGTASGDAITGISVGELWEPGIVGSIKMTQSITITDPGISAALIFNGNFQHLAAGMTVNIESNVDVNGTYVVSTINAAKDEIELETTGGDPVTDSSGLSGAMSIDKAGTQYALISIPGDTEIQVERQLADGSPDADWDGNLPSASVTLEIVWSAEEFTGNRAGPFVVCPDGETTETIEVDLFASSGLGVVDGESINARSRDIRIEYREVGATTWQEQIETVSGSTRDQLGWTFTVNLPSAIRPEIRVSRLGAEDVSVTSLDRLDFTALRCKLPTVTSYEGITTMAVDIVGSDEIASSSNNKINLEFTRKLPTISDGEFTSNAATRSISAAACYVAKSLGYADDRINLDEMERYEEIWTPRGDTFDYVFSDGTAKDAIDTILRAGFAEMTLENGVITPVRDQPREKFEDGYSPENMTAPLRRQFQGKKVDEPDGVEVEFTKAGTWTTETIQCLLPGDQAIKLDKVNLKGVTDQTRAWRIGMRRRRAQRYRRWTYSFETELDALNSQYLSYVPLVDDIPGYGKASILQSISADRIVVSEPLEFEEGKTHVVAYRSESGDVVGPLPATPGPDKYTALVSIPQPWPAVTPSDREPTHIYFGTTDRWSFPALVTEISPGGPLSVGVTATNYDDRVYADDDNAPFD